MKRTTRSQAFLRSALLCIVALGTSGCAVVTVLDEDAGLQALVVRRAMREMPLKCRLGRIALGVRPAAWEDQSVTQPPSAELRRRLVGLRLVPHSEPAEGSGAAEGTTTDVLVSAMMRVSEDEAVLTVSATCGASNVEEVYRFYKILGVWRSVESDEPAR